MITPTSPILANHIVMKSICDLIPYAHNARTHSDTQVAQIASSILEFGFTNPVLIDSGHTIIAGHGRVLAAQKLGLNEVPVVILEHLSDAQKRAYIIADNKLAELAGWDEGLLAQELKALSDLEVNLDLIGFSDQELEALFSSLHEQGDDTDEEDLPEVDENPLTQLGQVWILGDHKLLCGDAASQECFKTLLGDELVDLTFTDPPYNVNYGNTLKKSANQSHPKGILNDNLGEGFAGFLLACCKNILRVTKGACYICMSSSELHTLHTAFSQAGGHWSTFVIWAKNTFTLGRSDYQRQYEPILYGWPKGCDHFWCGKRNEGDIWFFNKPLKNDLHPTMKPVALCERAISNSSKTKDIILDCFAGSGSTLMACQHLHRRARLIELDPSYVDVIIHRWQNATGQEALDQATGKSFNAMKEEQRQQANDKQP